jgi:hypothetical protein
MKMGRRRRCSSVTYPFRYAPSSRPAAAGPAAHFDRNESHAIYGTETRSVVVPSGNSSRTSIRGFRIVTNTRYCSTPVRLPI